MPCGWPPSDKGPAPILPPPQARGQLRGLLQSSLRWQSLISPDAPVGHPPARPRPSKLHLAPMSCDLLKLEQHLLQTSPPKYVCLGPVLNTSVLRLAQLADGRGAPHARQQQGGQSKLDLAMGKPKNRAEN